ncbi:hypothetical protein HCX49_08340 [Sphingobacterium kitahiroshimense]|uniref:hypothetical protein n=1 Tax=Sphingobacterium sp. B16(2022) TaxID=2914044 RepID=UPI00143A7233|nr:hypothetical protein [Sphingobacterium sp. B16(2022)]NJI73212.1 hypothetical protein [Sphingobacterium sp. B16(2022)]
MMLFKLAGIYYQFFAQSKDYTLSEIKRKQIGKELIERRPHENDKSTVNRSYFLLLYIGLIDRVHVNGKMAYQFTQPTKINGSKRSILIHCALAPNDVKYIGLNYDIINHEDDIAIEEIFDPVSILKAIPKISNIIKNRFTDVSTKPTFKYLEKWLPKKSNGEWVKTKDFDSIPSLYRLYIINNEYYDYLFFIKGNFYSFPMNDLVTVQLVKSFLRISNGEMGFKYAVDTEELIELYPLLEPIKKILFTHHILSTGLIPLDYKYQVDSTIIKQLKRIYR